MSIDTNWQPMKTAPICTEVTIKTHGRRQFRAAFEPGILENEDGPCGAWVAADGARHPPCWTDGYCWGSNENEVPSDPPVAWCP